MKTGMIITAAIAGLFTTAALADNTPAQGSSSTMVHCSGINSCKGMGMCKTASNACKGQNSCKGKGMMDVATAKECTDKGGKVETMK